LELVFKKVKASKPIVKIKKDWIDKLLFITSGVVMLLTFIYPAIYYNQLPEEIPIHYNFSGEVDRYGAKDSIWFLPILGLLAFVGLNYIASNPHLFNYSEKITPENATKQYKSAARLMQVTALIISILFLIIIYQTITLGLD
jgi:uncharacterized membrane protein